LLLLELAFDQFYAAKDCLKGIADLVREDGG
jgi:hypothetical protein